MHYRIFVAVNSESESFTNKNLRNEKVTNFSRCENNGDA
jgi:hypothetical protein